MPGYIGAKQPRFQRLLGYPLRRENSEELRICSRARCRDLWRQEAGIDVLSNRCVDSKGGQCYQELKYSVCHFGTLALYYVQGGAADFPPLKRA
jgi:hypothetical protein